VVRIACPAPLPSSLTIKITLIATGVLSKCQAGRLKAFPDRSLGCDWNTLGNSPSHMVLHELPFISRARSAGGARRRANHR
jgi:hypothetical protein